LLNISVSLLYSKGCGGLESQQTTDKKERNMPTFVTKRNHMTAQRTQAGKVKLDRNGQPLCSVQLVQDVKQRHKMADIMQTFIQKTYRQNTDAFPEGKHHIGIDPVAYTCEQIANDVMDKMKDWTSYNKTDHIFESYVIRHNWMLDQLIEEMNRWVDVDVAMRSDLIQQLNDEYRINIPLPRAQQYLESLDNNPLFDTSGTTKRKKK
jgi:hypothetical protein